MNGKPLFKRTIIIEEDLLLLMPSYCTWGFTGGMSSFYYRILSPLMRLDHQESNRSVLHLPSTFPAPI